VDTAYIDILPDFSAFTRVLKRDLDRAFSEIRRTASDVFSDIEKQALEAASIMSLAIRKGAVSAEDAIDDLADSAHHDFNRIERDAASAGRAVSGAIGATIFAGAIGAFNQIASAVGTITSAVSGLGLIGLILALLPAIIALAAALADLIGLVALLPAGFLVAVAAIAPLVIAFQNFGDAVAAINEGDPEKIAEALKKLSPAAASVAKELGKLTPQLKELQRFTQEQFFAPLKGAFTELATNLLPTLRTGLGQVAHAFGVLAENVLGILGLPENVALVNNLFATTARIIGSLGPNLDNFLVGFLKVANAGLPIVEGLFKKLFDAVGNFGEFIEQAAADGSLQAFIDDALATLGELFDLGKALGGLLGTLFSATDDSGRSFIQTLTDLVTRMDAFFQSAEGQDALQDLTELVQLTGQVLGGLVNILLEVINFLGELDDVAHDVQNAFSAFNAGLMQFGANARSAVEGIPQLIGNAFQAGIDLALKAIGIGIGTILFLLNPQNVADALVELGPKLVQVFDTALTFAKNFLVTKFEEIKAFIFGVPDEITSGVGPKFLEAGQNLIQAFMNGFRSANKFIGDVAGDIAGAVKGFLNKAIDKINAGIASVDDVLPGSLPRIPRLARGGIIPATPGGQLFVGGEGGEDEVVAPLSKLQQMIGSGTTINVSPGAVVVQFDGVVPTQAEAFSTGQAAADGFIAALLARRDIRMLARAA